MDTYYTEIIIQIIPKEIVIKLNIYLLKKKEMSIHYIPRVARI